ncbi:MAG: porin family protein [Flammeovirgaceae bacterium]|nr:porin family protein [Flammeovirgaceae bacterium]
MKRTFILYLVASLYLGVTNGICQEEKWSLNGGFGIAGYAGDLDKTGISSLRPALNFEAWYRLHENLHLRGGFSLFQLMADDHISSRNRSFRANMWDVYVAPSLTFSFDRFQPLAYLGFGLTKIDPEGRRREGFSNLPKHKVEAQKVNKTALIVPFGLGFRYLITPEFAIVVDGGLRYVDSDEVDGVSRKSIPVDQLRGEAVSYHNSVRNANQQLKPGDSDTPQFIGGGNPNMKDLYGMFLIKFQYIFNQKQGFGPN